MGREKASSEIVGVILLIGIIVGAFGIFATLYIPTLKPVALPQVKLSMACNETISDDESIEFPCTRGSYSCHPFDNRTCEEDCNWRDYTENPQFTSDQQRRQIVRCMENCMDPICSDLTRCGVLYICHNGGDALAISDIRILVNGNPIGKSSWKIKQQITGDSYSTPSDDIPFRNGDTLQIPVPEGYNPVNTVIITYAPPSGGEITLAMNQFGTDIG